MRPKHRAARRAAPRSSSPWSPRCCCSAWARSRSSAPTSRATRASPSRCSRARRPRDADPAGPAVAGEAAALLLDGGARPSRSWARRRPRRACRPSWPRRCSWSAITALLGARLYGGAAGPARRLRRWAPACSPSPTARAASMDMLLAATVTASIGLLGLRLLGIAGPTGDPGGGRCAPASPLLAKGPLGVLLPALVAVAAYVARATAATWRLLAPASRSPVGGRCSCSWPRPGTSLVLPRAGPRLRRRLPARPQRAALHVHHPPPSRTVLLLPARAAGRPLPLVRAARARAWPRCGRGRGRADLFVLLLARRCRSCSSPLAGSKLPGYILPCLPPLALAGRARRRPMVTAAGRARRTARARGLRHRRPGRARRGGPARARAQMGEPPVAAAGSRPRCGALLIALVVSTPASAATPAGALRVLRVGAAGFLLLLATGRAAAPRARASRAATSSAPPRGREVLAWGAWRTAWMAGYFYNDGARARGGRRSATIAAAAGGGSRCWCVCGPGERADPAPSRPASRTRVLAEGPRGNALVRRRGGCARLTRFTIRTTVPPRGGNEYDTSSMNERMKKIPRPSAFSRFSSASGSGTVVGVEARPLVLDPHLEGGRVRW